MTNKRRSIRAQNNRWVGTLENSNNFYYETRKNMTYLWRSQHISTPYRFFLWILKKWYMANRAGLQATLPASNPRPKPCRRSKAGTENGSRDLDKKLRGRNEVRWLLMILYWVPIVSIIYNSIDSINDNNWVPDPKPVVSRNKIRKLKLKLPESGSGNKGAESKAEALSFSLDMSF